MHELSLALEVGNIAQAQVALDDVPRIVEIGLEVGDDAGVEVDGFAFCVEAVLATPPFRGATAVITRVPGTVLRVDYLEVEDGDPDD